MTQKRSVKLAKTVVANNAKAAKRADPRSWPGPERPVAEGDKSGSES